MPRGIKKPKMPKKVEEPLLPYWRRPTWRTYDPRDWADLLTDPVPFKGQKYFMGFPIGTLRNYIDRELRHRPAMKIIDLTVLEGLCAVGYDTPKEEWLSVTDLAYRGCGGLSRQQILDSVNHMKMDKGFLSYHKVKLSGRSSVRYCPGKQARAVLAFYKKYYDGGMVCRHPDL